MQHLSEPVEPLRLKDFQCVDTFQQFTVKSSKTCFHFQLYNMQSISQQLEVCSSMAEAAWREGFLPEVALHRFAQCSIATAETFPYWFRRKWPDPHWGLVPPTPEPNGPVFNTEDEDMEEEEEVQEAEQNHLIPWQAAQEKKKIEFHN